jgi:hypothetical protein
MKILIIDQNKKLIKKVKEAIKHLPFKGVSAKAGDIFKEKGVIVSASNPNFTCGGGLDKAIMEHGYKPPKKQGRKGNIIWTITVDKEIKSSRELIKEAIKFALSKINRNETLLLTGLGTGIGGLEVDDFVWILLSCVCEHYKYGWGIKYTQKSGYSFNKNQFTNKAVKYTVGKWVEIKKAPKNGEDCGHGLHLGKNFVGAGNYNIPDKIFFCLYEKKSVCGEGADKVRVNRLLPLYTCPRWLGYGVNGKKIFNKVGKKINPEDYNPYQATKLPEKDKLKKFTNNLFQVRNQVRNQVWNQVGNQVWNQVRNQVGATSYWAIKLYFGLPISHWFGDFIKLGVMIIFVNGKIKVFGKKGKYLGEYDEKDLK